VHSIDDVTYYIKHAPLALAQAAHDSVQYYQLVAAALILDQMEDGDHSLTAQEVETMAALLTPTKWHASGFSDQAKVCRFFILILLLSHSAPRLFDLLSPTLLTRIQEGALAKDLVYFQERILRLEEQIQTLQRSASKDLSARVNVDVTTLFRELELILAVLDFRNHRIPETCMDWLAETLLIPTNSTEDSEQEQLRRMRLLIGPVLRATSAHTSNREIGAQWESCQAQFCERQKEAYTRILCKVEALAGLYMRINSPLD
ncbi:MAG: hypothetical protein KDK78_09485, partial [Chlamydiia bacterium]|nr:hypothetical protein [Chlamydiia bacterium]